MIGSLGLKTVGFRPSRIPPCGTTRFPVDVAEAILEVAVAALEADVIVDMVKKFDPKSGVVPVLNPAIHEAIGEQESLDVVTVFSISE